MIDTVILHPDGRVEGSPEAVAAFHKLRWPDAAPHYPSYPLVQNPSPLYMNPPGPVVPTCTCDTSSCACQTPL